MLLRRSTPTVLHRLYAMMLVLLLMMGASPAVGAPPARARLDPDPNLSVFLPLVRTGERGLYGNVTENGMPAAGITLRLYRWSGGRSLVATTTTAANGSYAFTGAATLGGGQQYQVEFDNPTNPNRLRRWNTRRLYAYTTGTAALIGNFEIANIPLLEPAPGAVFVASQDFFKWTKRATSPTDTYALGFYRPGFDLPQALSGSLGWVDEKFIGSPPPGFTTGVVYAWSVHLIGEEGQFGTNFDARTLCFSACPSGLNTDDEMSVVSERLLGPAWVANTEIVEP